MTAKRNDGLISLRDVARRLKVSERTVYSWMRGGALSGIRLPGKYLFSQQDLMNFLNSRRPNKTAEELK